MKNDYSHAAVTLSLPAWLERALRESGSVFPGLEDFGIAPVETQASGRPVIAYRGGGALDTVIPGVTGTFFEEPDPASLAGAVQSLDAGVIDPRMSVAGTRSASLSRGSGKAVFVEPDPEMIAIMKRNADDFGFSEKVQIIRGSAEEFLSRAASTCKRYDIYYIDPTVSIGRD